MFKIEDTTEYALFEKTLKELINRIDSDIIEISIFAHKRAEVKGTLSIDFNNKRKIRTNLQGDE